MPSASPWSWGTAAAPLLENSFPIQVKQGSPTDHWVVSLTTQGKAVSERKTKTGLRKQAPPERSTGSLSLGPKGESLAWFYPHPLLRRAQERIHFWPQPSGKGLMEMLVASHTPFLGEETSIRTGFALGLSLGFLVELG